MHFQRKRITGRFRLSHYLSTCFLLFAPALIVRVWTLLALPHAGVDALSLVRGMASDTAVCAAAALLAAVVPQALRAVLIVAWCFLLAGNREFIAANEANMRLDFLTGGEQMTFLQGSVLVPSLGLAFVALLAVAAAAGLLARKVPLLSQAVFCSGMAALSLVALAALRTGDATVAWPRQNFMEENLRMLLAAAPWEHAGKDAISRGALAEARKRFYRHDLDGRRIAQAQGGRPNILLIAVESLSDWHVDRGMMPFLQQLRAQSLYYPGFSTQNRRTHTGMHALLCGEYPYLSSAQSKANTLIRRGPARPCLPEALGHAGYSTVFMQAANLGYMRKDLIAQRMGFDRALGNADYVNAQRFSGWGVDDASLYDNVLSQAQQLQQRGTPWFIAALTSGTHHPFAIPPQEGRGYEAAYRYADKALARFIGQLEAAGLRENTLILITSDESDARLNTADVPTGQLAGNHGLLMALTPDRAVLQSTNYFAQSDLLLSVLDYLNLPSGSYFGRSVFRAYAQERPLPFANIYLRRFYIFDGGGRLLVCANATLRCTRYAATAGGLFAGRFAPEAANKREEGVARALVKLNDQETLQPTGGKRLAVDRAPPRVKLTHAGSFRLYDGETVRVRQGDLLTWHVRLAIKQALATPPVFWLDLREENGAQAPLLEKRQPVAPGAPQDIAVTYEAPRDMALSVRAGVEAPPQLRVRLWHNWLEHRQAAAF